MRLEEMPNGEVVEVPDDIAPDALKRIKAQYPATRKQRLEQGAPRKSEYDQRIQRRADFEEKHSPGGYQRRVNKGLFASFGDEITGAASALIEGVPSAIYNMDIGKIGDAYTASRDTQRELDRRAEEQTGVGGTVAEIGGAVLNPMGTGAKGLQALGRGAQALGLERVAAGLGNTGARIANAGAVPQAIIAGGAQGALNAAGAAENLADVPGAVLQGGGLGALTGGLFGGATHLGARGVQILRDASPANAERTAFQRIAQLLDSGKTDARKVAREIAVTDARGGDAMVQDMLPSLRAQAGAISRKPTVSGSNELIERGNDRITERAAKFGQRVREDAVAPNAGYDALARGDALAATRKAEGQAGYEASGLMETAIPPTPKLQSFLREAPEPVQKAFRDAYQSLSMRDQEVANFVGPDDIFTHIPNLRTFDAVKRSFNDQIGEAMRAGKNQLAGDLSFQLDKLKGVLAEANPADKAYQDVLASQRDLYQQQKALQIGQSVLGRMSKEPRLVLRDLKALPENAVEDARIGIIDALINTDNKADPVAYFRSLTRNENQRKIMEFAFGGRGNLGRFQRWVNRETRATRADVLTAPGRQSETARFAMAADDGAENAGNVLSNAMRGYAFGGTIGAASGVTRTLQNIATGTSRLAQEEIAKILLSKGENLVKGTEAAAAYSKARQAGNRRRARAMGKAGQQIYTDQVGGE